MASKKKKTKSKKKAKFKFDSLHYVLITVVCVLLAYIFLPMEQRQAEIVTTTTAPKGFETEQPEEKEICDPCFEYFEYSGYLDGTLTIKNGDERIEVTGISGGRMIGKTIFDPAESLGISNIPREGQQEVSIKYKIDGSDLEIIDSATVNN